MTIDSRLRYSIAYLENGITYLSVDWEGKPRVTDLPICNKLCVPASAIAVDLIGVHEHTNAGWQKGTIDAYATSLAYM